MKKLSTLSLQYLCFCGVIAAAALFSGCQIMPEAKSDPTRQFVLNGPIATDLAVTKPAGRYQIGIRVIELPGYLHNRRDIAVRTAANEIKFQDFSRWAEPLETGINRVLKQRLLSLDTIGSVSNYPFSTDVRRDYDLVVRIANCEGDVTAEGAGVARFAASYDIIAAGGAGQVVVRRTFAAPDLPWNGKDFGALAALLSESVARFTDDIAANLPK